MVPVEKKNPVDNHVSEEIVPFSMRLDQSLVDRTFGMWGITGGRQGFWA